MPKAEKFRLYVRLFFARAKSVANLRIFFAAIGKNIVTFRRATRKKISPEHDVLQTEACAVKSQRDSVIASGFFVYYPENPYIPRVWRNFFHSLTRIRQSNELRMKQVLSVSEKRKRAIKVAATHAHAIAIIIERDNRRNHNIERPGCDDSTALWLGKAISIENELAFGR
jgi:hypothetical protein